MDGTRSASGGVTLPTATPGTVTEAVFLVSGLPNATYSIQLPNNGFFVYSSVTKMWVHNFKSNPNPTGTLGSSGEQKIFVGAVIDVEASQEAGTYLNKTDLIVTVAYN